MENILLGDGEAAGSDETFLEQAKLKARGALENAFLDDDEAAHLDSASLEQAKPSSGSFARSSVKVMARPQFLMEHAWYKQKLKAQKHWRMCS